MDGRAVEQVFDTLSDAIVYMFRQEQTSLLSVDRICAGAQSPHLYLNAKKGGPVPCSTIIRWRISSTLSSCDMFMRAGPLRACLWAIRPTNPLFLSDGVILSSIEQMLAHSGTMTLKQFVQTTQLSGADFRLFERFLAEHTSELRGIRTISTGSRGSRGRSSATSSRSAAHSSMRSPSRPRAPPLRSSSGSSACRQ
jgi:hypothetical protein